MTADCDSVFTALAAPGDLIEALTGPRGLTAGAGTPKIVVGCSTVSADASAIVRGKLAERGTALLAAPVMGNPKVVETGRMTKEVPMPVSATVHQLIQSLVGHGYGDVDFAAFIRQEAESPGITLECEHAEVSDGLYPQQS